MGPTSYLPGLELTMGKAQRQGLCDRYCSFRLDSRETELYKRAHIVKHELSELIADDSAKEAEQRNIVTAR